MDQRRDEQLHAHRDEAHLQPLLQQVRNLPTDEAVVAQAKKDIQLPLTVLDAALGKSEYLAGAFSLAEIGFMPYVEYLYAAGVGEELVGAHKNVASWWSRISQRPSWKQVAAK